MRALGFVAGITAVATGCSVVPSTPSEPRVDAEVAVGTPTFKPMLVDTIPTLEPARGSGTSLEAMVARNSSVTDLLLALFKDSDINLLVDESVQSGTVTFDIKRSTVEEAFEAMLRSLDLAYEWDGSFLRIRDTVRHTFDIDLLNPATGGDMQG